LRALPKVSVVILMYNALSTLGEALDKAILSALHQDYPNIEIVVVDNGSSDGTYEYVVRKHGAAVKVVELGKNFGYCLGTTWLCATSARKASTYSSRILTHFRQETM